MKGRQLVGARLDRDRFEFDHLDMDSARRRATERLHGGRLSLPEATYFVTFVTAGRMEWLAATDATVAMLTGLRAWHAEGDGEVLALTVMPDHMHVLFTLGDRLDVGRCVARWKANGRRAAGYVGAWQRDFWEHRVRSPAHAEEYALYIYLNPFRAGLLPRTMACSGWWATELARFRFTTLLGTQGEPPEEWMGWPDERFAELETGE